MEPKEIGCDVYRRWLKVGQLIPTDGTWNILDVGGNPTNEVLKQFIPHNITVANPEFGSMSGTKLEYPDNHFDYVISIDTLEHVDEEDREAFIQEIVRVAKYKAIIACPFDEPYVADMEKAVFAITNNAFLGEHIEKGLPSLSKTLGLIKDYEFNVHSNDSLIMWGSTILLNQILKSSGHHKAPEYVAFKKLMNTVYNPVDDIKMSYRKVIEIIKDSNSPTGNLISKKENKPAVSVPEKETDPLLRKKVSIVIPTYMLDFLEECVTSIEENTIYDNYEIIIVNDGGIAPEFKSYLEKTTHRVVQLEKNGGFSVANNAGFRVADGDYIMTLNADTLVTKGWLTALVDTLESDSKAAITYPSQVKMGNNTLVGDMWKRATVFPTSNLYVSVNAGIEYDASKESVFEAEVAPGVCMLMKRDVLFSAGLFDEEYYNGCEDYDLSLTVIKMGYKILHAPTMIYHYVAFARNSVKGLKKIMTENKVKFCKKWVSDKVGVSSNKDSVFNFFTQYGDYRSPQTCSFETGIPVKDCVSELIKLVEDRKVGGYVFEKGVPPHKYMRKFILDTFNGINPNTKILEIGPGGTPLFDYKEYPNWVGVDKNYDKNFGSIMYSHRKTADKLYDPNKILKGSWENLSELFEENTFDIIVSSHSFEHVAKPITALKEANKVLREGGFMINFVPDGYADDPNLRLEVTHMFYMIPDMIQEFFEYAGGFSDITVIPFRPWYDIAVIATKCSNSKKTQEVKIVNTSVINGVLKINTKPINVLPAIQLPVESFKSELGPEPEQKMPIIKEGNNAVTVIDSTYQKRYTDRNKYKLEAIRSAIEIKDRNILDIGCNSGYFSFEMAEAARLIYAFDTDRDVMKEVISKIESYDWHNVKAFVSPVEAWDFTQLKPDITLYMSVHHHLCNAIGLDKARDVLRQITDNTTTLVFECGQRNEVGNFPWKDKLPENFSTYEDIVKELTEFTCFKKFVKVGDIPMHGVDRYLVICER